MSWPAWGNCSGVRHGGDRDLTADGTASFDLKAFLSSGPIRWLIGGGVFLIAAIAIGTTIMVDNFRERALSSNERELENTVQLLTRHFDQQLEDFTRRPEGHCSPTSSRAGSRAEMFRGQLATLEWHEVLRTKVERLFRCRRHQCVRCQRQC